MQTMQFQFHKLLSVPTIEKDAFTNARVAVNIDQKSVLSRNLLVTAGGGADERDRIGAYLWSLDQEKPQRTQLPDSTTFGFVPGSALAYQVQWGDGVRFWDTRTHTVSGDYLPHELREDTTIGPAVSPDGKVMVTRSKLDHLRFWDIETRQPITPEIKQAGTVYGMAFSSDGKWLFCKTHKQLTIWESDTGKLAAGPLSHNIYSFAYSRNNNQLVTLQNNDEQEDVWRSELVIRSDDRFAEVGRLALEGHARQASWVDESHLLVVADNKMPGDEGPYSYGRKLIYLVSLAPDNPQVSTLMRRNWISNVHVAPDGGYFIIRTRQETSCWKVGQPKPVWSQPGNHLVYFGDNDWVLLHDGPVIAYSLSSGNQIWRTEPVGIVRVIGSHIWTCNENRMELWKVESQELR